MSIIISSSVFCYTVYGRFSTISSQFFAIYINTFHKTEVQTIILSPFWGAEQVWTSIGSKANGAVTNRRENMQLFSEGTLPWTDPELTVKDYAEAPMTIKWIQGLKGILELDSKTTFDNPLVQYLLFTA